MQTGRKRGVVLTRMCVGVGVRGRKIIQGKMKNDNKREEGTVWKDGSGQALLTKVRKENPEGDILSFTLVKPLNFEQQALFQGLWLI